MEFLPTPSGSALCAIPNNEPDVQVLRDMKWGNGGLESRLQGSDSRGYRFWGLQILESPTVEAHLALGTELWPSQHLFQGIGYGQGLCP